MTSDKGGSNGEGESCSRRVHVALGDRAYDVLIGPGLLEEAAAMIGAAVGKGRCGVVTDEHVARHHLAALEEGLRAAGRHAGSVVVKGGETSKSFGVLAPLCEQLLELGIERADLVIALGGGVIGDLAGFAASILRRGMRYVQIPTTLLAQVDSSVGGKTAINSPQGKNLIGAFHQPSLVLADTAVLATLPQREMRAGFAEVVKYGLLGDAQFFHWLEEHSPALFRHEPDALGHAIERCVEMKARIVERDETETGERALLNLGHTFGHALEAWAGYSSRLLHGEAVAIGMRLAFRLSEELGLCPPQTAARVSAHLKAAGLPTLISNIPGGETPSRETLLRLMHQDKKVRDGRLTLILVKGIGQAFITRDVAASEVSEFLGRELI